MSRIVHLFNVEACGLGSGLAAFNKDGERGPLGGRFGFFGSDLAGVAVDEGDGGGGGVTKVMCDKGAYGSYTKLYFQLLIRILVDAAL